jgi:hypothetical protein
MFGKTIDSSDMQLALAEIRYRPDFVVCHTREVNGVLVTKRTTPLNYWRAVQWTRMLRSVDSEIEVEIRPANRENLRIELLKVVTTIGVPKNWK